MNAHPRTGIFADLIGASPVSISTRTRQMLLVCERRATSPASHERLKGKRDLTKLRLEKCFAPKRLMSRCTGERPEGFRVYRPFRRDRRTAAAL